VLDVIFVFDKVLDVMPNKSCISRTTAAIECLGFFLAINVLVKDISHMKNQSCSDVFVKVLKMLFQIQNSKFIKIK
jgi:hypothetical protein